MNGSGKKYLIDSNIIIYHLNNDNTATDFLVKNIEKSAISQITYIEVLSFNFNKQEEQKVIELLNLFEKIDVNCEISKKAVANRKLKKIRIPDNIIASSAQLNNLTLVTRNVSDFNNLSIKLLNPFEN